ncbi:MAG: M14 family zinc carboxypeptidase [Bacteroidales bacterium]
MNRLILTILFLAPLIYTHADGWRPQEKQVILEIQEQLQINQLNSLKINFDIISHDKVRAYVIPGELARLGEYGITYEVEIEDLNAYHKGFWETKDAYHSYQEIIDLADSLAQAFPSLCQKIIYGTSLGGRELAALRISDNVMVEEGEPKVMFDGGIHGDEIGASENVIRFARDFLLKYGVDPVVTNLINSREIWLFLMVNPDGRVNMSRYNNNGVDLNRDAPYMWDAWGGSTGPCSQVESKALRDCMYNNSFVVHTSYHSGTEYVSCPWSYRPDQPADWNHIYQLAGIYASTSLYPGLPYGQGFSGMYGINGSTKDSNYGIMGSISWSMEISLSKQPPPSQIMLYYNYNYPAMIAMIERAGYGLTGIVTDATTGEPVKAVIRVNNYLPTYTNFALGDYHKYVLPGTYNITVTANGYASQTVNNIVVTTNSSVETNFQLQPQPGHYVYKLAASQIPGNNYADPGLTQAVIGPPDNIYYSIGKNGFCILDMQYPVLDGPGNDFIVHEGGSTPEGFSCYVASTIDGPWVMTGTGVGTTGFDLASAGIPEAQFIKIVDAGNGAANVAGAGFDLDAIEVVFQPSGVYLALYDYEIDDSMGNSNGIIDPGETVNLLVTVKNNGDIQAIDVTGMISSLSPFIAIGTNAASFGSLIQGQTSQGMFEITANPATPPGQSASVTLNLTANGGSYTNSFTLNLIIGHIPVLVIDLDGNLNSGNSIQTAIQANGFAADYNTIFPADLSLYSNLFLCLGIYSNNHVLSATEGQSLAGFLNNGGNLYMEGGDTWYYDPSTTVHPMFNINPVSDGSGDLGTITGQAGTFTEGMSFSYSGDNDWIDHIEPILPAQKIWQNQSPAYGTGVAHDAGSYKTIGVSHQFSGLSDGIPPSTQVELMSAYLEFFGLSGVLQALFMADQTVICEGEIIQFTDFSTGNPVSWEWLFEGGTPAGSTSQNPAVAFLSAGTFDITLTVSDGTDYHSFTANDYITVLAIPEIPATPFGPGIINPENTVSSVYETTGSPGASSYLWSIEPEAAGTIVGTGTESTVWWTNWWTGTALIRVQAENICGQSDFSGDLPVYLMITGLSEKPEPVIKIFPNPTDGNFRIENFHSPFSEQIAIEIRDSHGVIRFKSNSLITPVNTTLDIHPGNLAKGAYILTITGDLFQFNQKLMIK